MTERLKKEDMQSVNVEILRECAHCGSFSHYF